MFEKFLNTPKEFMVLYFEDLPVEHSKYCLNTSKIDTETMLPFEDFVGFFY